MAGYERLVQVIVGNGDGEAAGSHRGDPAMLARLLQISTSEVRVSIACYSSGRPAE